MTPEDAALRDFLAAAWPPAEAERRDGWLLRATPTVPRGRLNSALPLRRDPDLAVVDDFYTRRGLPPQVQVTPLDGHPRVIAALDAAGWEARWPTVVLAAPVRLHAPEQPVALGDRADPTWLDAWAAAEDRSHDDVRAHADTVLAQLDGRAAYALAEGGDAVGLAVADGPHCGLFCLATRSERRRTGLARAVVATLAAWARDRGAHTLCLEVELRNRPALALYGALGFARRYAYVHRVGRTSH